MSDADRSALAAAKQRIRDLEEEVKILRKAASAVEEVVPPKDRFRLVAELAAEEVRVRKACYWFGVSPSGFYDWQARPPSLRSIRHAWLTDVITAVHAETRGTYGRERMHAELVHGHGLRIGHNTVGLLMRRAGLTGLPVYRRRGKRTPPGITITDLVKRNFTRTGPNQLSVMDITEHPTREGKLFCCVVLDRFSRRVVGWSIDSRAGADLATNALSMAINTREPEAGAVIHGDHGPQFTSWTFTQRARQAGLLPSLCSVGDPCVNAVIESFWGRMQVELLNRQRWNTRMQLAKAMFEYIEGFDNTRRRHSYLNWKTSIEFEKQHTALSRVSSPASP